MRKQLLSKVLFSMFFVLMGIQMLAQDRTVTGRVTASDDGSGIPGASIAVKGTTKGTSTDADGNYKITVSGSAVLTFSSVGFNSQDVTVGNKSQINVAYCYWKDGEIAQAIPAVDRFIQLHPGHPNIDYAYYLKGLITFNDNMGFLGKLTGQDLSERDPKAARDAFEAFKILTTRYPNSTYTPDALDRMRYIVNALADSDVNTARYYFRRGAYLAAVNRAQRAMTDYDRAPAIEEALYILYKSYDALGMKDLSNDALRVLKLNYPQSKITETGKRTNTEDTTPPWWQIWRK